MIYDCQTWDGKVFNTVQTFSGNGKTGQEAAKNWLEQHKSCMPNCPARIMVSRVFRSYKPKT